MKKIKDQVKKYELDFDYNVANNQCIIKKIDSLRLEKNDKDAINEIKEDIFEYLLLIIISKILTFYKFVNFFMFFWEKLA